MPTGYARIEQSGKSSSGYQFTPVGTGCGGKQDFLNEYKKKKTTKSSSDVKDNNYGTDFIKIERWSQWQKQSWNEGSVTGFEI